MICFDFKGTIEALDKNKVEKTRELILEMKDELLKGAKEKDFVKKYIQEDNDSDMVIRILEKSAQVQKENAIFVILAQSTIGIALKSVISAIGGDADILFLGDSLSANSLFKVLDRLRNRSVYLYIIGDDVYKPEIGAHFRVIRQWIENVYGRKEAERRVIIATNKDSSLSEVAKSYEYMLIEYNNNFPEEYIAFHPVAYLPFFIAGVDLQEFQNGARESLAQLEEKDSAIIDYSIIRWLVYQSGVEVESVCTFEPTLESFCEWRARLKGNDRIYHGYSLYLRDLDNLRYYHDEYKNKIMETFINVKVPTVDIVVKPDLQNKDKLQALDNISFNELNNIACKNVIDEHRDSGMLINEVQCHRINSLNMGALTFFFILAGLMVGKMIESDANEHR